MTKIAEAVSPSHPDKVADRIAGALVDYAYKQEENPKIAVEVLIGHTHCFITSETSVSIPRSTVASAVHRASGQALKLSYVEVPQDPELAKNQSRGVKCGDNGIFYGSPMPEAHKQAKELAKALYDRYPYDGKLVLAKSDEGDRATICWSNVKAEDVIDFATPLFGGAIKANPLGDWIGGVDADTGLTGRKLASDFYGVGAPLGGGNMHGKDLTKSDVSVNIYAYEMARDTGKPVEAICEIGGDDVTIIIDGKETLVPFAKIVDDAREFIKNRGGFEKFAEWGL